MKIPLIQQTGIVCLYVTFTILGYGESGFTQVTGELAEMDRLEKRADEAIVNGDSEGAALSIGKAALMATLLIQKEEDNNIRSLHEAAHTLFRGQEKGFRALALFERAGGQPPASTGVCQFLSHAVEMVKESENKLKNMDFNNHSLKSRRQHQMAKSKEWNGIFQGLQKDLACERF